MPDLNAVEVREAPILRREHFGELLNSKGLDRIAIELGTDKAVFAAQLLRFWRGRLLICVDPWSDLPGYSGPLAGRPRLPDLLLATQALAAFPGRVQLLQMTSRQAAGHDQVRQASGLIDFVYVDADHSLEAVRTDLATYWPLLSAKGILAGHDWDLPEVQQAVREFALTQGKPVWVMAGDAWSWYIKKG